MTSGEKKDIFLLACARGLLNDVHDLLAGGVQPNVIDKDKRSGAHFAAAQGELEILQLLHSKGVDLDSEDAFGRSPIHYAALHDNDSIISFLATKSVWLDACDSTDCSALHLAARKGAAAAANRLLLLGANPKLRNKWDLTAFGEAIFHGHINVCTALDHLGAAVTGNEWVPVNGGYTLFHIAAASGRSHTLNWLLCRSWVSDKNSNVVNDTANSEKLSPLHCMVMFGQFTMGGVSVLIEAGADISAMDVTGRTPLSILQAADATPELKQTVAEIDIDILHKIQAKLTPKRSAVPKAVRCAKTANTQHSVVDAAMATGSQGYIASQDASLSVAARLQASTCPEHVAAVLQSVPASDQIHRVKLWAKLSLEEIHNLSFLSDRARCCLEQVHKTTLAINRTHAEGCLRRDERFQEAMQEPAVRRIVDAVIQSPQKGPFVRDQQAIACLNKLRGLRDVLSLNGGGHINLAEVLRPWSNQDVQRATGMAAALQSHVEATIDAMCNPYSDGAEAQDAVPGVGMWRTAQAQALSEIQPAPPRESRDSSTSVGCESDMDFFFEKTAAHGHQVTIWRPMMQKLLQQFVVVAIILAILWTQGKLPYQLSTAGHAVAG